MMLCGAAYGDVGRLQPHAIDDIVVIELRLPPISLPPPYERLRARGRRR